MNTTKNGLAITLREWALIALSTLLLLGNFLPSIATAAPTTTNSLPFPTVNGDILSMTPWKVDGRNRLVVAGNFTAVLNNGTSYATTHLAVIDQETGDVVKTFSGINDYVRKVTVCDGQLYVGGQFTTFGGTARSRLVRVTPTYTLDTQWRPAAPGRVRAIECGTDKVFYGGDTQGVYAVNYTTGAVVTTWGQNGFVPNSKKLVRSMLISPDKTGLYIGGDHGYINGTWSYSLSKVSTVTGALDTTFKATSLVPPTTDTVKGGEVVISLAWDTARNQILMGGAGTGRNSLRALDPTTGDPKWFEADGVTPAHKNLIGDTQAIAIIENVEQPVVEIGFHRNNPNTVTQPQVCNFHATFDLATGVLVGNKGADGVTYCSLGWDPKFAGNIGNNLSQGNGGVQAIAYDPETRYLFYGGQFTQVNGEVRQALAKFHHQAPDTTPPPTCVPEN